MSEVRDNIVVQKTILLISHNFSPEPTGIGKINGEMMHWLAKNGYACTVITTYPYYPHWKIQPPYKNGWFKKEEVNYSENKGSLIIYRCPFYIPSKPTKRRRLIQDFSYWTSMSWVAGMLVLTRKRYDLIITVAPPFHLGYLGMLIKKQLGSKIVYHIQDMQIEAAQGLNLLSSKKLLDYIYKIEKNIITKADYVSGISLGMNKKIKAKIGKDVIYFPNWVETLSFFPIEPRKTIKEKWGYKNDDIIFLYSGAIGEKQGLENILFTASNLLSNTKIKFIICGSGPYKEKLIETAIEKKIININFLPVQDKALFNEFLNMADFHLILQKGDVDDLVMPSKLATILAVGGVSIVTATPATSLFNLINDYDLGYIIEPDDHQSLLTLICNARTDDLYELKKKNARNYATQHLNIDNVMNNFLANIFN